MWIVYMQEDIELKMFHSISTSDLYEIVLSHFVSEQSGKGISGGVNLHVESCRQDFGAGALTFVRSSNDEKEHKM